MLVRRFARSHLNGLGRNPLLGLGRVAEEPAQGVLPLHELEGPRIPFSANCLVEGVCGSHGGAASGSLAVGEVPVDRDREAPLLAEGQIGTKNLLLPVPERNWLVDRLVL